MDSLNLTIAYFVGGKIKEGEIYKQSPLFLEFIKKEALFIEKILLL
jgi:hypothetical protein